MLLVVIGGEVVLGQRRLIYFPDRDYPGSVTRRINHGEDVVLRTSDGLELDAWLVRPTRQDRDAALLYLPGNGGHREGRLGVAVEAARLGFTVLLVDYRGYGGNPGSPSEKGLARDAEAAASWLAARGFPGDRTVYLGESIGTGVAARLATTHPPAGLLLRSPYTSLVAVAEDHYPWLPSRLMLRDRFDTLSRLPDIEAPVVVLAGDHDEIIAPEQSREVAENVRNLRGEVVLPGVGHNDPVWFGRFVARQAARLAAQLSR